MSDVTPPIGEALMSVELILNLELEETMAEKKNDIGNVSPVELPQAVLDKVQGGAPLSSPDRNRPAQSIALGSVVGRGC